MALRDLKTRIDCVMAIAPIVRTANTAVNGATCDLQGYNSAMAIMTFGAWTDGTHTPKLQDSPDNSVWTDVVAADMVGTFIALSSAVNQNASQRVGYIGSQRYLRLVLTTAGATVGAGSSAEIVRGDAAQNPL